MKKILIGGGLIVGAAILIKGLARPVLKHFKPHEFGVWWFLMDDVLLTKMDAFREEWGYPVRISPVKGGIGRRGGHDDDSQHNVDRWGEVRAIDLFPQVPDGRGGFRYLETEAELEKAYRLAIRIGFTGVGVYTDTKPGYMIHVDTRTDREPGNPARWSRIEGKYKSAMEAFA